MSDMNVIDLGDYAGGAKGTNDLIFDAGTEDFEQSVMAASMETPILVDFWAPWCGPCKQLMPVLEQAVQSARGAVRLAKVNIDDHPELAQALRIQSVPTVFAFFKGQPVTAFQGVKTESEIKRLIGELSKMAGSRPADAVDIPASLAEAAQALSQNNIGQAQALYMTVLEHDENNAEAFAGLVRTFIATGATEQAQAMMDDAPEEMKKTNAYQATLSALEMAQSAPTGDLDALQSATEKKPDNHSARFDYAMALFVAGQKEEAMDQMIEIIRRDRAWEDEKARKQLLKFFDALGHSDPLTLSGRRKLSSVLFS